MDTGRLYYADATLTTFHARVLDCRREGDDHWVTLDRTAFYPTGGGQPHDAGWIDDRPVLDVVDEAGSVRHRLAAAPTRASVRCRIDAARRRDHMQQHTAQHLLSRLLLDRHGLDTQSFGIGAETSAIDVDAETFDESVLAEVEREASTIIAEARPVTAAWMSLGETEKLRLRKAPEHDPARIVTIHGIEDNACGGTHVASTAEIGLTFFVRTENVGKRRRLHYVAGERARRFLRKRHDIVTELAHGASTGADELSATWDRLRAENGRLRKALDRATALLLEARIRHELERAGERVVLPLTLDANEGRVAPRTAASVTERPRTVLLLGWIEADRAALLFARSDDLDLDLRPILGEATALLGGKGGGRPERVQGGGPRVEALGAALERARTLIESAAP